MEIVDFIRNGKKPKISMVKLNLHRCVPEFVCKGKK